MHVKGDTRTIVYIKTQVDLYAWFGKDDIPFIRDVVNNALNDDDFDSVTDIMVAESRSNSDHILMMVMQRTNIKARVKEASCKKVCSYSIQKPENLFKSIDPDFIFSIRPGLVRSVED